MNKAIIGKVLGWAQFGITTLGTILSAGLPTNGLGWAGLFGSLLTAIGIHAASSTDGAK